MQLGIEAMNRKLQSPEAVIFGLFPNNPASASYAAESSSADIGNKYMPEKISTVLLRIRDPVKEPKYRISPEGFKNLMSTLWQSPFDFFE